MTVAVGHRNELMVKVGRRTVRPNTAVPLFGGELRYFADGTVTITKPGLAIRVVHPPAVAVLRSGLPKWASYITL